MKRILWPVGAGLAGMLFLSTLYLGLVSWSEGPEHALALLQEDRWFVAPIILGFGFQAALYTILKKQLFLAASTAGPGGAIMGASGSTSTVAMVACCIHHATDVLPILGLTAAATFLAQYRIPFMISGLTMTWLGVLVMSVVLLRAWREARRHEARQHQAAAATIHCEEDVYAL
jgi:hypothetical protein